MKRGLVIGKFMPLHEGHVALIRFAAAQCDELIVSMSHTPGDPIDPAQRFLWIIETFRDLPGVRAQQVRDNFDDESLPIGERTAIWADFIKKQYPPIDILFSSEEYGEPFARHLGVPHQAFDIQRKKVPISASQIRERPLYYWEYIPKAVRPYFVRKICFYGPESTGKSVLIARMAELYQTEFVPEVAKEMITSNRFTDEDSVEIAYAQNTRVREKIKTANKILLCDTDVITTEIYSQRYNHRVPQELRWLEDEIEYDLYFLFDIDTPWIPDGMRDLKEERPAMFGIFKEELEKRKIKYVLVSGDYEERERIVRGIIDGMLSLTLPSPRGEGHLGW